MCTIVTTLAKLVVQCAMHHSTYGTGTGRNLLSKNNPTKHILFPIADQYDNLRGIVLMPPSKTLRFI